MCDAVGANEWCRRTKKNTSEVGKFRAAELLYSRPFSFGRKCRYATTRRLESRLHLVIVPQCQTQFIGRHASRSSCPRTRNPVFTHCSYTSPTCTIFFFLLWECLTWAWVGPMSKVHLLVCRHLLGMFFFSVVSVAVCCIFASFEGGFAGLRARCYFRGHSVHCITPLPIS